MYRLTNKDKRAVGLPSPYRSVVLEIGKSEEVTDKHYGELIKAVSTLTAIKQGTVVVEHFADPEVETPDMSGVRIVAKGRKWIVFVNGHQVTDKSVNKKKARYIAAEYE